MKKTKLMAVIAAGICAISLAVGIVVSNKTVDSVIRENAEVLANGEGGRCTGPKKNHVIFWIVCECTNDEPCSDNHNCQS